MMKNRNKGAPEIELEAYHTAWRELREWLKHEQMRDSNACLKGPGNHVDCVHSIRHDHFQDVLAKLQELEKSHVLD